MIRERESWPDVDGRPVALGDWVEVFCSWSPQPKFDGRPVQVVDVLTGRRGTVFHLRDPETEMPNLYMLADGHGYRRVNQPAVC